jgi:hypothetical protein
VKIVVSDPLELISLAKMAQAYWKYLLASPLAKHSIPSAAFGAY